MIKTRFKVTINRILDGHSKFSASDFEQVEDYNTLRIVYEFNEKYYFKLDLPDSTSIRTKTKTKKKENQLLGFHKPTEVIEENIEREVYVVNGVMCPGNFTLEENFDFEGEYKIESKINEWLDYLWDEISAEPIARKIKEQDKYINDLKSKLDNVPEDFFTQSEAEDLKLKLDELEKQISAVLSKNEKEGESLTRKQAELKSEIENLKTTIEILNKKHWFKTSFSKMYKWISKEENRKLLKDGVNIIKPLLPDIPD